MKRTLLTLTVVGLCVCSAHASTWTGADAATDIFWNNNGNWDPSAPGYHSEAMFPEIAPAQMAVDLNGISRTGLYKLWFETAGYSIVDTPGTGSIRYDDDGVTLTDDIVSKGAGINTVGAFFEVSSNSSGNDRLFYIEAGNRLHFSAGFKAYILSINGGGTMVLSGQDDTARNYNARYTLAADTTLLLNQITATNNAWDQGNLGGNGGMLTYGNNGTTHFNGATLAPGGDGVLGDEIGTFTIRTNDLGGEGNWNVNFNSGTTVEMQFGADGTADKIMLELTQIGNGNLNIAESGTILALSGTTIQDGTYTLFENLYETANDIAGTFETVTYNGVDITGDSRFTLHYNPDSITIDVVGVVPEPMTMSLLAAGGLMMLKRRRR